MQETRDAGWILGSGRSPGGGNGNPLQYSCLGNPRDRGAWWATVLRVTKELDMTKRLSTQRETPSLLTLSTSLLSLSTHLPILDSSYKWNHTIYGSLCFLAFHLKFSRVIHVIPLVVTFQAGLIFFLMLTFNTKRRRRTW